MRSTNADAARLIAGTEAILLDFDGPVCSVFAGYAAPRTAAELVALLQRRGVGLPPRLTAETDPLQVLRWAGSTGDQPGIRAVEDALCAAELRAVKSAVATPYSRETIVAARQGGVPVAVVSNNSAAAVSAYLVAHRLADGIFPVVGRAYADPARMKPNPEPVRQAVRDLGVQPGRAVLIGDSRSDIEAGRAAGVRTIGYANRPAKVVMLREAGADAVIDSMWPVAGALRGAHEEPRTV